MLPLRIQTTCILTHFLQTTPKIYSFDADFQLVRKASSGKQWEEPKYKDEFFLDQSSVDGFIKEYTVDKKKPIVVTIR